MTLAAKTRLSIRITMLTTNVFHTIVGVWYVGDSRVRIHDNILSCEIPSACILKR